MPMFCLISRIDTVQIVKWDKYRDPRSGTKKTDTGIHAPAACNCPALYCSIRQFHPAER